MGTRHDSDMTFVRVALAGDKDNIEAPKDSMCIDFTFDLFLFAKPRLNHTPPQVGSCLLKPVVMFGF